MSTDFRRLLVGKKVERVDERAGTLSIQLEDGWSITIWARWLMNYPVGSGAALTAIVGDGKIETISFDGGQQVAVELKTDLRCQHESMAVYGPNSLIVVWE